MFNLKSTKETWGLGLEVAGLAFLLGAAAWQAVISDSFASNRQDSIAYEQYSANLGVLLSVENVGDMMVNADAAKRTELNAHLHTNVLRALRDSGQERYQRMGEMAKLQSETGRVRLVLAILGGLLVIAGKSLVFLHRGKKT